MLTWKHRSYGYLDEHTDDVRIRIGENQTFGGFPIGIIYIEGVRYPYMPGNVCNGWTYDFPIRLQAVKGLGVTQLFAAGDDILPGVLEAAYELQAQGVRAISSGCGFFGNFQQEVSEALDIPVGLSSLIQIPWIETLIKPSQKIGVLTASGKDITEKLLSSCGITRPERLIIRGLENEPEFSAIIDGRGEFDNGMVREELVNAALEVMERARENGDDVGAFLLECSDMPPYAAAIQQAVGLPVFDFIGLIKWLKTAVTQRPYHGFM